MRGIRVVRYTKSAEMADAQTAEERAEDLDDFFRGGPFYDLQKRIRLIREDHKNSFRRAALFVVLAWVVPLLLSLYEGNAWGRFEDKPYLLHLSVWARYFISVGIFIAMEPTVGRWLAEVLKRLVQTDLIAPGSKDRTAKVVTRALNLRNSYSSELVCALIALLFAALSAFNLHENDPHSWMFRPGAQQTELSLAGWWNFIISAPIFHFLLVRWGWRLIIWGKLLHDLSGLDLRLVVTHPDGFGGIGFLGEYPNAYTPFIFAISCVDAAAVAELMQRGSINATTYAYYMAGWLVFIHVLISLPLFAFSGTLSNLKNKTLDRSRIQSTWYQRAMERKIFGENIVASSSAEATPVEDIEDSTALFAAAKRMPTFLFSRATLLPVSAAAVVPFVAAGATLIPLEELLQAVKRLLLI